MKEYLEESKKVDKKIPMVTVVLITYNRLSQLQDTLTWLEHVEAISNIIIVDNGSKDGTEEWLSTQSYEYIYFDEGVQGYGVLWNIVLSQFEMEEYIVFIEAGVYPEQECLLRLAEVLKTESVEIASPMTNCFMADRNNRITGRNTLMQNSLYYQEALKTKIHRRSLCANWKIWAVRREIFENNGAFEEQLSGPEEALADYSLRLIRKGLRQMVCREACAFESFCRCDEIYPGENQWRINDQRFMKTKYGMNYFNLKPNDFLVERIQKESENAFKVLEIGCDLGATLVEIQNDYPKCETYGLDINKAAVEIAMHVTQAKQGNIDELQIPFGEKIDYIIFGDVLEHLRHPEDVVKMCRDMLNEDGCIIASIPNVMHISVLEQLIDGRFRYSDMGLLDRTHIHFFTYREIIELFINAGYTMKYIDGISFKISERQKGIKKVLLGLSNDTEDWMYETFQYIVEAQK